MQCTMMMIDQYRADVRKFYVTQKAMGNLSLNLTYPTVSKLRDECLMLFNEGCGRSDLRILTSFLGRPMQAELHESAIRCCDADRFKALCNFMKKDIKTSEKNFEMLAWLTGYGSRPYAFYLDGQKRSDHKAVISTAENENLMASEVSYYFGTLKKDHVLRDVPPNYAMAGIEIDASGLISATEHKRGFQNKMHREELNTKDRDNIEEVSNSFQQDRRESGNGHNLNTSFQQTPVTLEYPSGVKLSLSTNDLGLISKLIRL